MSRQFSTFARFLLLVLAVTAVLTLTVHASPTSQETPRPRFGLEDIPYQASAENSAPNESALSVTAPNVLLPWSKVAFQSLRNGSWDIFVGNDDGTGQTAVVGSGNAEIQPHLNRGNTKIVYASNSGGDYEIYTANFNGSGQTALTSNTTSDGNPSWSPDGSKIVFEAYRNGEADIYVMNANGTNQVRLTTHPDFDGMPSWSPDGSKIAFVSRRTGGYRIYVMNADGSGQTQLSNQPYSLRPQWSPDGTQIAYDADGDGDGWQDLWRMNADGSSQTLVVNPGGQTDAWTSSWSPDGSRIVYTLISFVYYQGNWYWTTAYPDAWSPNLGTTRLSSNGTDWDATWQTSDSSSPALTLNSIPQYSRNPLTVSWVGTDVGSAGIKSYDVQYRLAGATNWSSLSAGTTATTANFNGSVGQTYQFRVRATDKAFNRSNWQYNFQTTLYSWLISGNITDNRGNPITNASINTTPASFQTYASDFLGFYQNYAGGTASTYSVSWLKSGYGNLPTTPYSASEDAAVNLVLPPADNMLSNWDFEAGWIGVPGTWQTSGLLSLLKSDTSHTGTNSVLMGELSLPEPENISLSNLHSAGPKITTTEDGVTHILWGEATTTDPEASVPEIRYINISPDGTRSVPQTISVPGNASSLSAFHADKDGRLHVVWLQFSDTSNGVYYAQRDELGNWSAPLSISQVSIGYANPQLITGESGLIYLVWHDRENNQDRIFFAQREINGVWSDRTLLSPTLVSLGSFVLGIDPSEGLHVVWNELGSNIFAVYRPSGGNWTTPVVVSDEIGLQGALDLSIDGLGKPHIIWTNDNNDSVYGVFYASRNTNGSWTTPLKISGNGDSNGKVHIAATNDAKLHVMWQEANGTRYIFRNSNGNWGSIQSVQSVLTLPSFFEVDNFGVLHVAWQQYVPSLPGTYAYYSNRSTSGVWASPIAVAYLAGNGSDLSNFVVSLGTYNSLNFAWPVFSDYWSLDGEVVFTRITSGVYTLFQDQLIFPPSMVNPTLSFFVKPTEGNNADKLNLNVTVTNGTDSQVFPVTGLESETWSHHWFDLSDWQNEELEISINYVTSSATALQGVYIDEVSLGSASTDIWLDIDSPLDALPGKDVVFTVQYGNRSSIDAQDVSITAVLPPQLTFLSASLPPSSQSPGLTWNIGDLPANSGPISFTITARVKNTAQGLSNATSTVNITTSSTELEVFNNVGQSDLLIGTRLYTPLIIKN